MKNTIIIVIIVAVIAFTVGLYVGDTYGTGVVIGTKVATKEMGDYKNTFADGWKAAQERLEEAGLAAVPGGEIKTLSGDVSEVKGDRIIFIANLYNPLASENQRTKTAIITKNTKITFYRAKTMDEKEAKQTEADEELGGLRLERDSLSNQLVGCDPGVIPEEDLCAEEREELFAIEGKIMDLEFSAMSEYIAVENAKLSDIKKNYSITVDADEDISEKSEFEAAKIEVRENMIMPEMETEMAPGPEDIPAEPITDPEIAPVM